MTISTSEIKNLIQENIKNTQKREKCLNDCNTEEFDAFDLKVREKYNGKNINERVEYLSYVIGQLENIKNIKDMGYNRSSMEIDALERIGAIIWVCIYEDIYKMIEFDYVPVEMKKRTNYEVLEKYAKENFKHNYKLYLLISKAAQDFNLIKDEENIEGKIKTKNEVENDFFEELKEGSVIEVRQYIKKEKTQKIAEAILDTRIVKYFSDSNKKNKPTISSTEEKIISVYDNILNKNQTKSVLKTVNILFNKTKYKDQLDGFKQFKSLYELVSISEKMKNEKNIIGSLEVFFSLLKNYLDYYSMDVKTEVNVLFMIIEGLVQSKETNFYKNSIFISQLYKYISGKGLDKVSTMDFREDDCIQSIKNKYSSELQNKNPDDDSRTIVNRLYNNREEIFKSKYIHSSAKYISSSIVDYLIKDYIEIHIINNIERAYFTYDEEYELMKKMDQYALLEKFNIKDFSQNFNRELKKYFGIVKNYKASKDEYYKGNYKLLIEKRLRLVKTYLMDSEKISKSDVKNLNELIFWMDHNWWGVRNMKHSKLQSENTDEMVMRILLEGKNVIDYCKKEERSYAVKESFYLFVIMLQSMMGMLYFTTIKSSNVLNENFSRGKIRNSAVVLGRKLERDKKVFERLSEYIFNKSVDHSKINNAIAKVNNDILAGDIHVVDEMLGLLSDKTYATIESKASIYDIFREMETEHNYEED